MKRVLVSGANGFIGSALCKRLISEGWQVTAAIRHSDMPLFNDRIRVVTIGNIGEKTDWSVALKRVDIVVHLAARVHVLTDDAFDPLQAYRQVNAIGTRNLAKNAACAGVKRFVYLSSVKVNGEENKNAYNEYSAPAPEDAYGISKLEGENHLKSISGNTGMESVVVRPPLVYGAGVKANFLALMNLIYRKVPLPLACVSNRRSFIYLGNLVDSIITCMTHSAAAGQTYMVSDDRDVSTPELIRLIAIALKTHCFLFPFPQLFLRACGDLIGKGDAVKRLLGSLTVDIAKIKNELAWAPPFSVESGLQCTANWYKER